MRCLSQFNWTTLANHVNSRSKMASKIDTYRYLTRVRALECQYWPWVRESAGWAHAIRGLLSRAPTVRLSSLARAMSLLEHQFSLDLVGRLMLHSHGTQSEHAWSSAMRSHHHYGPLCQSQPALSRSIVLKAPKSPDEKGILLFTFEYNWVRLLLGAGDEQIRWLHENYHFVFSSSSSPTNYGVLALALARLPGTLFVQLCNLDETERLRRFSPRLHPLPMMPCDWLNPDFYAPKPMAERNRDVLMVSFFAPVKRHWEFFSMLAQLPTNLRVTLVGQTDGIRNKDDMIRIARHMGVKQELEIYQSIPIERVTEIQCDSKVSVIMSRREGCCVAAVESLFAGSALAMRADAHVGPLSYINEQTGMRLRPGHLAQDMRHLLDRCHELRPQDWAEANISCFRSKEKFDQFFKDVAQEENRPWSHDIALPTWRPHPTFVHDSEGDSLKPAYAELNARLPNVFPADLISNSWR
jgi:glycosyltransferase involved in cell wall biosynthesis